METVKTNSYIIHKTIKQNSILRIPIPQGEKNRRHLMYSEGILTHSLVWSWVLVPVTDYSVTLDMRPSPYPFSIKYWIRGW